MLISYVKNCEKLSPNIAFIKIRGTTNKKGRRKKNHNWNDNVTDIT